MTDGCYILGRKSEYKETSFIRNIAETVTQMTLICRIMIEIDSAIDEQVSEFCNGGKLIPHEFKRCRHKT